MTTRSVSMFWVGKPLSHYEHLSMKTFLAFGHEVQIFTYDPKLNIPDGVLRRDAREVLPETDVFENKKYPGTFTFFANLFRYELLQKFETLWVDLDILCLTDQLPQEEYVYGYEALNALNNGVLAAPRDSRLLVQLSEEAQKFDRDKIVWGQTGPKLLQRIATELDLLQFASPIEKFYPIHYREVWKLFDPHSFEEVVERLTDSTFLHLWNEYLRRAPIDLKKSVPPPLSYLGRRFAELDLDTSQMLIMDDDWARDTWQHVLNPHVSFVQKIANKIKWELTKRTS